MKYYISQKSALVLVILKPSAKTTQIKTVLL